MTKSDATIRIEYADTLAGDDDAATLQFIRELESRYRPGDPWEELPAVPLAMSLYTVHTGTGVGPKGRWSINRLALVGAVLALALLAVSLALAASGIINLGKPSSTLPSNPYFPLSGFHRIRHAIRKGNQAELLVISTGAIGDSPFAEIEAGERFPVVKALEQFGTFTGLQPLDRPTCTIRFQGREIPGTCASNIDWAYSAYRSRYVVFVHRDFYRYDRAREAFVPFQKLSATERALYRRYAQNGPHVVPSLPLIAVGDYLQVKSQIINAGDFQGPVGPQNQPGPPLSFDVIQSALVSGQDPPQTHLVEDVNDEANVITALICHADGLQSARACGRAVIKQLLRHVR